MNYNKLDFFNCQFSLNYQKILFKVNNFSMNSEDHNCKEENIYNDWITIYLDKNIDLDNLRNTNIIATFDKNDFILDINNTKYKIFADEFHYFVGDMHGNFNDSVENIVNYFCKWLQKQCE